MQKGLGVLELSIEKRDARAVSNPSDDATEVLASYPSGPSGDSDSTTVFLPLASQQDSDPTQVLPAYRTARVSADQDPTRALPQLSARQEANYRQADPTQLLSPSRQAEPSQQAGLGANLGQKVQAGAAQGLGAAKEGLAKARAKAQITAQRVQQERAARAAASQKQAAQGQQASRQQMGAPAAQPGPFPTRQAAYSQPSGPNYRASRPAQPYPGPYPGPTSAENSPSGRLQMLTPSHIRQTRPSLWTLIQHFFAAGTLLLALLLTLFYFVTTPSGQTLDEVSFQEFAYQFMTYTEQTSNLLDFIPAAAGILAAIGIIFVLVWKHRFVPALVGLAIAAGANLSTQILKNYLLVKPNLGIQEALGNSSPSGHTTFAAAAGLALFLASPKRFRPTVALLSMFFTVAAGYSTIINGWHRPADVVAAILVTGLWGVLGLVILRFMRSEELDMGNTQRSGLILVPLLSISGFFIGFCSLALYWVTASNPIPGSAFMAAICLIAAAACLTTSIQIALLRPQNKQRSAYRKVWGY